MPKQPRLNIELMKKLYYKDVRKYLRYLIRHGLTHSQRAELLDRLIMMEFQMINAKSTLD